MHVSLAVGVRTETRRNPRLRTACQKLPPDACQANTCWTLNQNQSSNLHFKRTYCAVSLPPTIMRMTSSQRAVTSSTSNGNLCEVCGTKPKHVDSSGVTHPFCGRTCAARSSTTGAPSKSPTCRIRGCNNVVDPTFQSFCSEDHAKQGVGTGLVQGCHRCKSLPQTNGQMCARCAQLPADAPRIWNIKHSGTVWREFEREWNDRWRDGNSATIEQLFEISYPPPIVAEKDSYCQLLKSTGGTRLFRTFHASQCICDMGTNGPTLCNWGSCGICNIVKSAFREIAFGAPFNKGRHGNGLYSCANPCQADRYATSCLSSPYRVMIACDVVLPQVPSNNNSVLMDELIVVRDSAAITPRYVVMYTKAK